MNTTDELAMRLAGRLRDLRQAAGFTGISLGNHLGWTQSKVSKIETGRTLPSAQDVIAWAKASRADDETASSLVDLLAELRDAQQEWQHKFRRGQALVQHEYDKMARNATLVRNFETATIPGLLQTADYARQRIMEGVRRQGADPAKVEQTLAARLERGQALFDTAKRFEFLIAEPALSWRTAPDHVIHAQLARLLTLLDLPNVTIAILPMDAELDDTPQHGFIMFDDVAVAETLTAEEVCRGDKAARYSDLFVDFMGKAKRGEGAAQIITGVMSRLQVALRGRTLASELPDVRNERAVSPHVSPGPGSPPSPIPPPDSPP